MMREAEIRALDLLGRDLPDALRRVVGLAATVTGAEHAELNLITATSQHTIVSANGPVGRTDVGASFCGTIVREPPRTQLVPDSRLDERFRHLPLSRDGVVVTYAAAPLVTSAGVSIGSLCVYDAEVTQIDQARLDVLTRALLGGHGHAGGASGAGGDARGAPGPGHRPPGAPALQRAPRGLRRPGEP